jgi:sigma-B regulation protein RsbU (phosphoserine phosphatase)
MPRYIPQIDGWELAAYWQPAREVGGDYYDIFPDQDGYGLVIAHVTDKGMPAALFMAFTRSIIRASMDRTQIPSEGIRHANRLICAESVGGLYVSLFFAELHPASGEVYYVNAGHNPPLFYGQNPEQLNLLATTGYQLGMEAEGAYDQQTITLNPGDFIFLYTDGVIDALNPQGEVFGMERLQKIILSNRMESANGLVNSIKGAIDGFTLSTSPFDDITFIVAKRI